MSRILTTLLLFGAVTFLVSQATLAITINTAPVGNPGNANDPQNFGRYGGVAYNYRIGTTEVTVGQYTAFLNAVADTDTYGLFNPLMTTILNTRGIARSGPSGNYSYSVIGSANHPVTFVSWGDAARFSNWLHNGQPTGLQNASTTEGGAYLLNGATTEEALGAVTRNAGAQWFIPSENEWYKAAYHQPAAQGGDVDNYWAYATRNNSVPNSDQPPGAPSIQSNVANFIRDDNVANGYNDGYAVTGSNVYNSSQNYLTDVGAYTTATSYYGTFDQEGNVFEWNEFQRLRGGSFFGNSSYLSSSWSGNYGPTVEWADTGFRVATVPEPGTAMLAGVACGLMWLLRKRFKYK
jgi:formylglycine-generating enzyme